MCLAWGFWFCFFFWRGAIYPSWCSLSFLDMWLNIFYKFVEILNYYLFKYFFCSILFCFWNSDYTYIRLLSVVPQLLDTLLWFFFFSFIFSLYVSVRVICTDLSASLLILFLAVWSALLSLSKACFILFLKNFLTFPFDTFLWFPSLGWNSPFTRESCPSFSLERLTY